MAFGGSAQSPESLTVRFGLWVTALGLHGSGGVEEVKTGNLTDFLEVNEFRLNDEPCTAVSGPHSPTR